MYAGQRHIEEDKNHKKTGVQEAQAAAQDPVDDSYTSGYDHLTTELKNLYGKFVFYDIYKDFRDEKELCFRLIRYMPKAYSEEFYLKEFYMRLTRDSPKLSRLEHQTVRDLEIEEADLKTDEILELFTILKEDYLNEWIQSCTSPRHNITDANDPRLGNYNFHTEVECTVNDYLNNYSILEERSTRVTKSQRAVRADLLLPTCSTADKEDIRAAYDVPIITHSAEGKDSR
eukprot:6490862-Amphidinium_carterae.3